MQTTASPKATTQIFDNKMVLRYGGCICQKCGAYYKRRHKRKTSNQNQCGTCNRSETAKRTQQRLREERQQQRLRGTTA